MSKVTGTVKWFSNRKGFGFITPSSDSEEAIFVHQTSIFSDGDYRTLTEGAEVEYEVETEESGKLKAINVTGPGGEALKAPKRDRKRGTRKPAIDGSGDGDEKQDNRKPRGDPKPRDPPFHDVIGEAEKEQIAAKGVDLGRKMTIDVALGDARIKLGQGGYAGLAHADGMIGEGTYTCDEKGSVTFVWERCLVSSGGQWIAGDTSKLTQSFSLSEDAVGPVQSDETAETLWGADKSDPKDAFAENGFKMKRVVLARPAGGRSGRRGGPKKEANAE